MNLWKRAGCQTESKALEKSRVERIVRETGLGLVGGSIVSTVEREGRVTAKYIFYLTGFLSRAINCLKCIQSSNVSDI